MLMGVAMMSCGPKQSREEEDGGQSSDSIAVTANPQAEQWAENDEMRFKLPASGAYEVTNYDDEGGYGIEVENEDVYVNVFRSRDDDCKNIGEGMASLYQAGELVFDEFDADDPQPSYINGRTFTTTKVYFTKGGEYFAGWYSVTEHEGNIYYIKAFVPQGKEELLKDAESIRESLQFK